MRAFVDPGPPGDPNTPHPVRPAAPGPIVATVIDHARAVLDGLEQGLGLDWSRAFDDSNRAGELALRLLGLDRAARPDVDHSSLWETVWEHLVALRKARRRRRTTRSALVAIVVDMITDLREEVENWDPALGLNSPVPDTGITT